VAESRAVAAVFGGGRAIEGRGASESRLRSALRDARLVHVATHGLLNVRNPLFSRIDLATASGGESEDDGRLEVHEVSRLAIGAQLVFLSGCETGLGVSSSTGFNTGEDYATLTRAFLSAGAGNVIATLWRVEDQGSATFASLFYKELEAASGTGREGLGVVVEALSRTQREMLRSRDNAPFYWAGVRLTGSGDLPREKERPVVRS
jgi:CHAT domain-containing protein